MAAQPSEHEHDPAGARHWEDPASMLDVDDARARILAAFEPLPAVEIDLLSALGCVLAEDVVAADPVPPFTNSAMDGYALRADDTARASSAAPVRLSVVATIAAGEDPRVALKPGQAARIMTGAVLPAGADAVIRFEEVVEERRGEPDRRDVLAVGIPRPARRWENVRQGGEDIAAGQCVAPAGMPLTPARIGVLASLNVGAPRVHRRPQVGILSTGNEVVDLGPPLRPGQIRNSNSYTLAALVAAAGGVPRLLGVARDEIDDLRDKLRAAGEPDLLLTSGGVSLGDYDMVKDVLQAEGEIELWQVRIKPGKPMAFGRLGRLPLLGLPGNPVAAYVAFLQFGRPAIRKMLGYRDLDPPRLRARLLEDHENRGRRRHFVRGVVRFDGHEYVVRPVGSQGSGVLTSVAAANCFIVLPEEWSHARAGSMVDVELLAVDAAL